MYLYIWPKVYYLTNRYHPGGGLVVIAESLEAARQQIISYGKTIEVEDEDYKIHEKCDALFKDPSVSRAVKGEPGIWIFPDAGCCR